MRIKKINPIVDKILSYDEAMQKLTDDELKAKTQEFKDSKRVNITNAYLMSNRRNKTEYKFSCIQVGSSVFVTRVK